MNFPNATAEEYATARRGIVGFCLRQGWQIADAEDAAQDVLIQCMTRQYRRVCPATLPMAVRWRLSHARRYGVHTLRTGDSTARARHAAAVKRGGPMPPRDIAPAYANPATVAEQAEGMSFARRRLAERLGITPASLARQACGFGPLDDDDAAKVSPVTDSGPGYTPPAAGCRGLHDTDPNPASRRQAALAAANDARRVAGLPPVR